MKTLYIKIFILPLTILLLSGCRKKTVINNNQAILFEVEYVSNSNGNQHNGFVIDKEGKVMIFKDPETWNYPDKNLKLSSVQVSSNLANCINSGTTIPEEELISYARFIKNISASKVTALKHVAADTGSVKYLCYEFDEKSGVYKGSLIKMEGAVTCENLNFYSRKVAGWLKNIYETTGKK
jgi:hypothetical protein